jgi:DNA polymerase III subunit gamma/tau
VLRDLAEITHWISVVKITPDAAEDPTINPDERVRGVQMAKDLPMRAMTRMWQMLLKALDEVAAAPNAMMAAEMAVIRLTHVAELPSPEDLVRKLQNTPVPPAPAAPAGGGAPVTGAAPVSGGGQTHATATTGAPSSGGGGGPVAALAPQGDAALARYPSFDHVIDLIRVNRDVKLLVEVETTLQLAQYQPGRIEFVPTDAAPADLAQRLGQRLQLWTGNRWAVTIVNTGGAPTIAHLRDAAENALKAQAQAHPLVQAVLAQFPKARITDIRTPDQIAASVEVEALPEVDDEWDPFEDG